MTGSIINPTESMHTGPSRAAPQKCFRLICTNASYPLYMPWEASKNAIQKHMAIGLGEGSNPLIKLSLENTYM